MGEEGVMLNTMVDRAAIGGYADHGRFRDQDIATVGCSNPAMRRSEVVLPQPRVRGKEWKEPARS